MVIMMTPKISHPAEIAEVDGSDRFRKLHKTMACSGGVISILRT
jgi:hypothetical protein